MIDYSYLQSVSVSFVALYALYRLCFYRLTFYSVNRVFLLCILPLSLVLPLLTFEVSLGDELKESIPNLFVDQFIDFNNVPESELTLFSSMDKWTFLGLVYIIGVGVKLFLIVRNLYGIYRIKQHSFGSKEGKYWVYKSKKVIHVFSCFRWVFLPENKEVNTTILAHEKIHGAYLHTLDLILLELYIAFFWFNPFVYFFHKDVKAVHEFQVDAMIIKRNFKKSEYLQLLLDNLMNNHKAVGLYNYFSGLTIKKRVKMITKKKSPYWALLSYMAIVPVVVLVTMSFTRTEVATIDNNPPSILPIKKSDFKRISSAYGMRMHPIDKVKRMHRGIDIPAKTGTPVIAAANGKVINVVFKKGTYGKLIVIQHDNFYTTLYAQLSNYAVKIGDKVKQGQIIGYVGSSGKSTAPHLHYEVHKGGKPVDPKEFY